MFDLRKDFIFTFYSFIYYLSDSPFSRSTKHVGGTDQTVCPEPQCRLPGSSGLPSRGAAGQTLCSRQCLIAPKQPSSRDGGKGIVQVQHFNKQDLSRNSIKVIPLSSSGAQYYNLFAYMFSFLLIFHHF